MSTKEMLAVLVVAGVALSTALMVGLHLLRSDLDPISRYESEYAVGPYSLLMMLVFILRGASAIALAIGLYVGMDGTARSLMGLVLLGAFGVGMWLLAVFPTDLRGAPDTTSGAVHNWVALAAFVSVAAAALLLTNSLGSNENWVSFGGLAWIVALAAAVSLVFFYAAPWLGIRGISGLTERIFIGLIMLWIALAALHSLRL